MDPVFILIKTEKNVIRNMNTHWTLDTNSFLCNNELWLLLPNVLYLLELHTDEFTDE